MAVVSCCGEVTDDLAYCVSSGGDVGGDVSGGEGGGEVGDGGIGSGDVV